MGAERLSADRVHGHGEAGEHRVAGDVGESDGQGASGELHASQPPHADYRDDASEVAHKVNGRHRQTHVHYLLHLLPNLCNDVRNSEEDNRRHG